VLAAAPLNFISVGGRLDKDLAGFQETVQQQLAEDKHIEAIAAETTSVVSGGLAVGYVIWLVRGGYLLCSLLSSMPAWRLVDPLPILDYLDDEDRDAKNREDEDESLEELLRKSRARRVSA
jgi:hypothetical protein